MNKTPLNMSSRIALITIMLVCFNEETARAFEWDPNPCPLNIPENTAKESLHTFTGPAGTTAYTIVTQSVTDRFVIDSSGKLSSATGLDYESDEQSYTVEIMASHSDGMQTADVACEIRVTDINDEDPEFVQESFFVEIVNNVAIDTSVLTVSATDKDVSETFNKVVYSIKDGENGVNFTMHADTGVISAKTLLAAADPLNLTLTVVATDNNDNSFKDEALVTVCLGCKTSGSSSPEISLFASMALVFSVFLM